MEKVTQVYPLDDYKLKMQFNTGETRIFDARPYLQKGVFQQLQDETRFRQAYVALDTVCWPGGLDIAPETLYDRSQPE
ncbi:DUF2442 domain-containing protein [Desulfonatronum thiodismutans]|uniref:DUF2442 domain-containing protein n=1 Tax=Desulfonatronum thiodismutans TaxID=159290 RepID=UPI0004ABE57F|nr:DUF2442 domain-containing protein [Desulfonatronum thiodismutans]